MAIVSLFNHEELYFAIALQNGKIIKSILPKSSKKEALEEVTNGIKSYEISDKYKSFAEELYHIYNGKPSIIKEEDLNLDFKTFQKKVLDEVLKIPHGNIKTYKQISKAINSRAYRAVGTAIAKNPLPLIIPCHRVIRSDLKIGNFYGGTQMKKEILENEGIKIKDNKIQK